MFTVRISTRGPEFQGDDEAGPILAKYLREIADRVEKDISIVPGRSGEWVPEHYRMAGRSGVRYSITDGKA